MEGGVAGGTASKINNTAGTEGSAAQLFTGIY